MAKVLVTFKEKFHNDHVYRKGEPYPAEGFKADPERVKFLSENHPKLNEVFLQASSSEKQTEQKKEIEKTPDTKDAVPSATENEKQTTEEQDADPKGKAKAKSAGAKKDTAKTEEK
ncbi:hypothetical protein [Jeotgalibacillus haloalkalitolerans]|uniref:Uncharacterized protein n=1 Tax=Jeotgalibacillus haloalkalitolerans TaxID=3104292 RepID=A0ABU5KM81_9BACL|nr:hypothetical protein [Jeotgalibacillus sp. HH7-29]MDZ5712244.1 hypothetical protein [Jeotgalibacillus sp. HH7-29]